MFIQDHMTTITCIQDLMSMTIQSEAHTTADPTIEVPMTTIM